MLVNIQSGLAWALLSDHRIEFVNQATLTYSGISNLASLSDCLAIVHPDDAQQYLDQLNKAANDNHIGEMEMRLRRRDGQYQWVLCRILPMLDPTGRFLRWISISDDINDRKQAELDVNRKGADFLRIVDFLPCHICVTDADGEIIYANKSVAAQLEMRAEQIIGRSWFDFLHPENLEAVQSEWLASTDAHIEQSILLPLLRMQFAGEYRWLRATAVPLLDELDAVRRWCVLAVEIHELVEAKEALEVSKRELAKIIETLPLGVWCTSADGQPTYINKLLRDYAGVTLDQAQNWGWAQLVHPEDRENSVTAYKHALDTGGPYTSTHRLRSAEGNYRWYEQRAAAFRDTDGQIKRWFGVSIDIDEQVQAEDHLRETRANLARAVRAATVAELSASIAHELNQPLTSVIANAQAARRWLAATPPNVRQAVKSIDMIVRDGSAADNIMKNVRALFKHQAAKKMPTRVDSMVKEAVRLIHEDSQRKKASIECVFAQRLPLAMADRIQIQQVLINLICNGIEAAEHIDRMPRIRISAKPYLENQLLIEVADNGPGVTDFKNIFEAFVTTKDAGMGIGLAISRSIILEHGGQLWVENIEGDGACFKLSLPTA